MLLKEVCLMLPGKNASPGTMQKDYPVSFWMMDMFLVIEKLHEAQNKLVIEKFFYKC